MFRRAAPTLAALAKRALVADLAAGTAAASTASRWAPAAAAAASALARGPALPFVTTRFASTTSPDPPSPAAKNHTGWGQTKVSELLDFKVCEREVGSADTAPGWGVCPSLAERAREDAGSARPLLPARLGNSPHPPTHSPQHTQGSDRGAWLWCSKDDLVIDAVKKVRGHGFFFVFG